MAKLYFYYASMNAGKSTNLLQADFNYRERHLNTLCFLPEVAANYHATIQSRIGIQKTPVVLKETMDLVAFVKDQHESSPVACVFVDEAQFLKKGQVQALCTVVDEMKIPVVTYGLRTDFRRELFEGSQYLLAWADCLVEVKAVCFCGKKATMTARLALDDPKKDSEQQIECAGNERYIALCRHHHVQYQSVTLEGMGDPSHNILYKIL